MNLRAPRGTKDILPPESYIWLEIERVVDDIARLFSFDEIRTPIFESVALFKRGVGESTDIVSKEMYLFSDRGGDEMALRPELTASVVRSAIEHNLISQQGAIQRLYYNSAPMFRYERPQMGRQRQFHQFGVEILGAARPLADLQSIAFALAVYDRLGFKNFLLKLNTLGSTESRATWRNELLAYLRDNVSALSDDSKRRLEENPLRVLDSKNPADQDIAVKAPSILDYLDTEDREHFEALKSLLQDAGIAYQVTPNLVRGLDYYTRTVYELTSTDLGSQDALCGGGRYDGLIKQLGGPDTPAVGFAAGVERLVIVLEKMRGAAERPPLDCYIVVQAENAQKALLDLASGLRATGLSVSYDLQGKSMKAQMREADRLKTRYVLILGAEELSRGEVTLKTMATGQQEVIQLADARQLKLS